jgi:hypothetical protein
VKFVIDAKTSGLELHPFTDGAKKRWVLTTYSNSDWARAKAMRTSVSRYSVFLMGAVILWKSKIQKPLSGPKWSYYAISDAAKEIKVCGADIGTHRC